MPFPRLPIAVGLILLALPAALAEPLSAGGVMHGTGTMSSFTAYRDSGETIEGGAYKRTLLCLDCQIRMTITTSAVFVVQNGTQFTMTPGTWEIREFRGTFAYTPRGLGHIEFRIEGEGAVVRVA